MLARHILPAILLVITVHTCVRVGAHLGPRERSAYKVVTAPPLASLDPKILDSVMLGHGGLYGDFATIWAIQFLADPDLKKTTTADELNNALLAIIKHRPKIEGLYLLSCYVLGLDFKRPELCEKISIEGLAAFPNSWRIPMTQGFIATFELKDDLKAAAFYQLAASRPGSPEYVGKLAARLTARGYADGQDLNDTLQMMETVPGGTRIIEILQERIKTLQPPDRSGDQK